MNTFNILTSRKIITCFKDQSKSWII